MDLFHKEDGGEIEHADDVNISEEFIQKVEAEMIREVIQLLNENIKQCSYSTTMNNILTKK